LDDAQSVLDKDAIEGLLPLLVSVREKLDRLRD
jgi:hypothetical protein